MTSSTYNPSRDSALFNISPSFPRATISATMADRDDTKRTIVFFHPDLGIGGAERLVVDAAVGLQERGHRVVIFTSHCDPKHCFEEARDGKQLQPCAALPHRAPASCALRSSPAAAPALTRPQPHLFRDIR